MRLIPKNWAQFQHYKDRCPPWIKLHRGLLNDRAYMCLPLASKALAPLLWLLASESNDGTFDASIEELTFRLRMPEADIGKGLNALIEKGFFLDASTMLAPSLQDATPETEKRERTEGENRGRDRREKTAAVAAEPVDEDGFDRFWETYDYKTGKYKAKAAWKTIRPNEQLVEIIIEAAGRYSKANPDRTYYKHPSTWLNGRHWEDDPRTLAPKISRQPMVTKTQHQLNQEAIARSIGLLPKEPTIDGGRIYDVTAESSTKLLG